MLAGFFLLFGILKFVETRHGTVSTNAVRWKRTHRVRPYNNYP